MIRQRTLGSNKQLSHTQSPHPFHLGNFAILCLIDGADFLWSQETRELIGSKDSDISNACDRLSAAAGLLGGNIT